MVCSALVRKGLRPRHNLHEIFGIFGKRNAFYRPHEFYPIISQVYFNFIVLTVREKYIMITLINIFNLEGSISSKIVRRI